MPTNTIMPRPHSPDAEMVNQTQKLNLTRQLKANQIIREHARELINPTGTIEDLLAIELAMRETQSGPPDPATLAALKARADIKFKLLDKALPNLKATEVVAHHEHNHSGEVGMKVTDIELAQRLQLWRKDNLKVINPTPAAVDTKTDGVKEEYEWL
jgi:hypothetical protein